MPKRAAVSKAPLPRKSDRTRQRVLDEAARLFARAGYANTNLADVAAAAGMQAGSLYYHFDSKDELVYEVLRFGVAHSFDHVRAEVERLGAKATSEDQLRAAIHAHLESLHTLGDYARAGLRIVEQSPAAVRKRQYANQRSYGEYWEALLDRARAEGVLPKDIDLLAARLLLFGAINATVDWPASARRSTDELTETLMALLLRP